MDESTPTYSDLEKKIATLEVALDTLREKEKKKKLDHILKSIVHEFNNLMMVIQGNISIMLHDTNHDGVHFNRLKSMERYIKSGTRLAEKLLDYVEKQGAIGGSSLPLGDIVDEVEGGAPRAHVSRGLDIYRRASKDKYRILLVDDESLILDVGGQMLSKIGLEVVTAEDGMSAIEIYKKQMVSIDLVILDLIMPGIDGIDTYQLLKEMDPNVKVLISSGYRKDERVENFLKESSTGFIKKPFSLAHLSDEVRKLLRSPSA